MNPKLSLTPQEIQLKFYELKNTEDVACLLEVDPNRLKYHLYRIPEKQKYRNFFIPKKAGGTRKISTPISAIKIIQQKLNYILQCIYTPKNSTHGFVAERNIVTNAHAHIKFKSRFILNIDLQDFFPSINFGRVYGMFRSPPYEIPDNVSAVLAQICCYKNEIPQGAPTSPIISNMICTKLDSQLEDLAYSNRCIYTRYADDITFSTIFGTFSEKLIVYDASNSVTVGTELNKIIQENGFIINSRKIRLQHINQRQEITGLVINSQKTNVKRKYIRQIRAMLHAWKKFGIDAAQTEFLEKYDRKKRNPWDLPPSFQNVVRGKIEFLGMVRGHEDLLYIQFLQEWKTLAKKQTFINSPSIDNRCNDEALSSQKKLTNPSSTVDSSRDNTIPARIKLLLSEHNEYKLRVDVFSPEEVGIIEIAELPFSQDALIAILKVLSSDSLPQVELSSKQTEKLTELGLLDENISIEGFQERVGRKLFDALCPGKIGEYLRVTLNHVRYPKKEIGLDLLFYPKHPALTRYPWELIFNKQHLLQNGAISLTRNIRFQSPLGSQSISHLNVVYVESRPQFEPPPSDSAMDQLPKGEENEEYNVIQTELKKLEDIGKVTFQKLETATYNAFHEYLKQREINVLHFDGHGTIARRCPICKAMNYPHYDICQNDQCGRSLSNVQPLGYLAFQSQENLQIADWVSSEELSTLLSNFGVQLAILSACHSGEAQGKSIFFGVGQSLIQSGIPVVIAMQAPISVSSSILFMKGFYKAISQYKSLPKAIYEGRQNLLRNHEWFFPIIYWRSKEIEIPFLYPPFIRKERK